jgi:hypothetical protein
MTLPTEAVSCHREAMAFIRKQEQGSALYLCQKLRTYYENSHHFAELVV